MNTLRIGIITLGVALGGCVTPQLPKGAELVGGGLQIEYRAPSDGTIILVERKSGRLVATQSLEAGDDYNFQPNRPNYNEVMLSLFGTPNDPRSGELLTVPTNTFFQLYFVPDKAKKE